VGGGGVVSESRNAGIDTWHFRAFTVVAAGVAWMVQHRGRHRGGSVAGRTGTEGIQAFLWTAETGKLQRRRKCQVLGGFPGEQGAAGQVSHRRDCSTACGGESRL
jgi:hypothetical protein